MAYHLYPQILSDKRKLIAVLSLLLSLGFIMTSLASYFASKASIRASIIVNELPLTSDNIYSDIQKDLVRPIFISSMMASDTFLRDWVLRGGKRRCTDQQVFEGGERPLQRFYQFLCLRALQGLLPCVRRAEIGQGRRAARCLVFPRQEHGEAL